MTAAKPVRAQWHRSYRSPASLWWALGWAALFTAMHAYWYLGGTIGLGDAPNALPPLVPSSIAGGIFEIAVVLMFAAGLGAPMALLRGTPDGKRRRLLVALMWTGAVILVARGGSGLLDDAVRQLGPSDGGITGLSYERTLGTPTPSTYTLISTDAVDANFLLGGALFTRAARSRMPRRRPSPVRHVDTLRDRSGTR